MVLIKFDSEALREELDELEEVEEELQQSRIQPIKDKITQTVMAKSDINSWLDMQSNSEIDIVKSISINCNVNLTEAMELLPKYPDSPVVGEKYLPDLVKEMRMIRRGLKGSHRDSIAKGIDHLITAYQEYITKCLDSVYWLRPYTSPLKDISINEGKIKKLYSIKDGERREVIIDNLCKMWNAKLDRDNVDYGREYSRLTKEFNDAKKEISTLLRQIKHQDVQEILVQG